jgi:glycosyltransferase involved in cell wall biosynthesis
LAAGRPILAGDTADIREVIHHDLNGIIVPPGDVNAAAKAILTLKNDPEKQRRLGEQARKDGKEGTWLARAKRILQFVQKRLDAF